MGLLCCYREPADDYIYLARSRDFLTNFARIELNNILDIILTVR